jgi:hypothetical protein
MQTGVFEQPVKGTYSSGASLFNRVYLMGDVTASDMFIGSGAAIRIDTLDATSGGEDSTRCEIKVNGSLTIAGTECDSVQFIPMESSTSDSIATWIGIYLEDNDTCSSNLSYFTLEGADIGIEHCSDVSINHARISNTFDTGIISKAELTLDSSNVSYSNGRGIFITGGAKGTINESIIDHHENIGISCYGCAIATSIKNSSVSYNGLHGIQVSNTSGITIESCLVNDNAYDGIRCISTSPSIYKCSVQNNGSDGIDCSYTSDPSVSYSSIEDNEVGIVGVEDSHPLLGDDGFEAHNCIVGNDNYHVINLSPPDPIYARYNYWNKYDRQGHPVCPTQKFSGYVICSDCDSTPECLAPSSPPFLTAPPDYTIEEETANLPKVFDLGYGAPNPFNPVAMIPYQIPPPGAEVKITIYNVLGQRVIDLVNGYKAPGYYKQVWKGVNAQGTPVASGVYFVNMRTRGFMKTVKLVVIK